MCFARFVSEPLLVEHHANDHQTICASEQRERSRKEEGDPDIAVIKVVDPEVKEAMKVIQVPDPDPFADKWHPAHGQVKRDDTYKFWCRVCHRYLKNTKVRVEHFKQFHPEISYDCKFCPDLTFYAIQDLVLCNTEHIECMSTRNYLVCAFTRQCTCYSV